MPSDQDRDYKRSSDAFLARLDERTKNIERAIETILNKLDEHYVTQEEFKPVKLLVFSGVGLGLVAIISKVIAHIIK